MIPTLRHLTLFPFLTFSLTTVVAAEPSLPTNADDLFKLGDKAYDTGDYQRAKNILLPLAQAGLPDAMNLVGLMHFDGIVFPKDHNIECDWYEKAAKAGFARAMYNLSICYNQGLGRPKDQEKMLKWRVRAAENGSIPAMINLAALDPNEGEEYRKWMLMAQEHNSAYAKVSLWLQGYKSDSQMNLRDFVCVSWRILIMDGWKEDCD